MLLADGHQHLVEAALVAPVADLVLSGAQVDDVRLELVVAGRGDAHVVVALDARVLVRVVRSKLEAAFLADGRHQSSLNQRGWQRGVLGVPLARHHCE